MRRKGTGMGGDCKTVASFLKRVIGPGSWLWVFDFVLAARALHQCSDDATLTRYPPYVLHAFQIEAPSCLSIAERYCPVLVLLEGGCGEGGSLVRRRFVRLQNGHWLGGRLTHEVESQPIISRAALGGQAVSNPCNLRQQARGDRRQTHPFFHLTTPRSPSILDPNQVAQVPGRQA